MGEKGSWFTFVRRFFTPSSKRKKYPQKRNRHPANHGPPRRTLREATEEHRKQAVAFAVATAAAAEAAVAAANAAVEVVRLTNAPYEAGARIFQTAAVKIQTGYRGHLARKALSALKGIVKLQAVVRGELLRKKFSKKLAYFSLFSNAHPLLHIHRAKVLDYLGHEKRRHSVVLSEGFKSEQFKLHNTHRSLDVGPVSSNEAAAKREWMRQHSFSHRERRNDQNLQEKTEKLKPILRSNAITIDPSRLAQLNLGRQETAEDLHLSRRSFCHVKQKLVSDYGYSLPSSPVFPAYMAATESTKAKSRSFSTPRQRLRLSESYGGPYSPRKLGFSINGDIIIANNEKTNCNS